jgi:hypothetical protein
VTGNTLVGGLIGRNYVATVTSSYWDTQTSGQATSAGGTGKTTAQMMNRSTFVGWDFATIWNNNPGLSYPVFQYQNISYPGLVVNRGPSELQLLLGAHANQTVLNELTQIKGNRTAT